MGKVAAAVLLLTSLFIANVYCEQPTANDYSIYYEFIAQTDQYVGGPKGEYEEATKRFAASHNMAIEQLEAVIYKIEGAELSQQETRIVDEWSKTIEDTEKRGEKVNVDELYQKLADKYGLSVLVIENIIERAIFPLY